jgi:hypothetical protein
MGGGEWLAGTRNIIPSEMISYIFILVNEKSGIQKRTLLS